MLTEKEIAIVQEIACAGIWYSESNNSHAFVGIVRKDNGQLSLRAAVAKDQDAAEEMFEAAGEVLHAVSVVDLLSHIQAELDPQPGANLHIL